MTIQTQTRWVRLVAYLIFWTVSYFVLMEIFATSSARWLMVDYIYTSIFVVTLLIPVTINDWYLLPKILKRGRYTLYFTLLAVNIVAGALLNQYLFDHLIDHIFPGYYFISYFEFTDLMQFFSVFVILSMLVSLSLEWFKLQEQRNLQSRLEKENVSAELKALTAQVNPHFLFNSLTILYALATKSSPDTPGVILKLSDVLRYVIHQASAATVTLKSELTILHNFIDLQRYRIHPSTQLDFSEAVRDEEAQIAPMLFLPLLENAFKHGVHEEVSNAFVRARIHEEGGLVHFTIVNNKSSSLKTEKSGFGLKNLAERLQLIYPNRHSLQISETESTFAVSMQVNLK